MITDLRILLAVAVDKIAEAVAPVRNSLPVDLLGADQPMGEYPDLPMNVPAGVEAAATPRQQDSAGGHPNLDVAAGVIDRHYATYRTGMARAPFSAWVCQCGQLFTLRFEHAEHVADLIST